MKFDSRRMYAALAWDGVKISQLAKLTPHSEGYASKQLDGERPLTSPLRDALIKVLSPGALAFALGHSDVLAVNVGGTPSDTLIVSADMLRLQRRIDDLEEEIRQLERRLEDFT